MHFYITYLLQITNTLFMLPKQTHYIRAGTPLTNIYRARCTQTPHKTTTVVTEGK